MGKVLRSRSPYPTALPAHSHLPAAGRLGGKVSHSDVRDLLRQTVYLPTNQDTLGSLCGGHSQPGHSKGRTRRVDAAQLASIPDCILRAAESRSGHRPAESAIHRTRANLSSDGLSDTHIDHAAPLPG